MTGIDFTMPGARKLPKWLTDNVSLDVAERISVRWEDQHWCEVVRDTPQETWLALAQHPQSILNYSGGDGFAAGGRDPHSVLVTITNTHRSFLGLFVACWEAMRAELATEAQRKELLDADENLKQAQLRLRNACSAVPHEIVQNVLKRFVGDDD
jgi:hypothetical protein